jgi:hypothetical protein
VEVVGTYFKALFLLLPNGTEENYETNPVRITRFWQRSKPDSSVHFIADGSSPTDCQGSIPAVGRGCSYSLHPAAVEWVPSAHDVAVTRLPSYP